MHENSKGVMTPFSNRQRSNRLGKLVEFRGQLRFSIQKIAGYQRNKTADMKEMGAKEGTNFESKCAHPRG